MGEAWQVVGDCKREAILKNLVTGEVRYESRTRVHDSRIGAIVMYSGSNIHGRIYRAVD